MKKIIVLTVMAFALVAGSVTVMTVHPQSAVADPCPNGAC